MKLQVFFLNIFVAQPWHFLVSCDTHTQGYTWPRTPLYSGRGICFRHPPSGTVMTIRFLSSTTGGAEAHLWLSRFLGPGESEDCSGDTKRGRALGKCHRTEGSL